MLNGKVKILNIIMKKQNNEKDLINKQKVSIKTNEYAIFRMKLGYMIFLC